MSAVRVAPHSLRYASACMHQPLATLSSTPLLQPSPLCVSFRSWRWLWDHLVWCTAKLDGDAFPLCMLLSSGIGHCTPVPLVLRMAALLVSSSRAQAGFLGSTLPSPSFTRLLYADSAAPSLFTRTDHVGLLWSHSTPLASRLVLPRPILSAVSCRHSCRRLLPQLDGSAKAVGTECHSPSISSRFIRRLRVDATLPSSPLPHP